MVEALVEELSNQKYNLIVEGTLRTVDTPAKTAKLLKENGIGYTSILICI